MSGKLIRVSRYDCSDSEDGDKNLTSTDAEGQFEMRQDLEDQDSLTDSVDNANDIYEGKIYK